VSEDHPRIIDIKPQKTDTFIYKLIPTVYQLIPKLIKMPKLEFTKTEMIEKRDHKIKRYPNLNTVLMVEDFLKKHRDLPVKMSELRKRLPRQVMYPTLKIILDYLWKSGKIIFGPKGIQWIYAEPEHLRKMIEGGLEI
jgi:hypothetical protein